MGKYDMKEYIEGFKKRVESKANENKIFREEALKKLDLVVKRLKEEQSVMRIFVFGSLIRDDFSQISDIDIAVEGLSPKQYYRLGREIEKLPGIPIDLICLEDTSKEFQKRIEKGGGDSL